MFFNTFTNGLALSILAVLFAIASIFFRRYRLKKLWRREEAQREAERQARMERDEEYSRKRRKENLRREEARAEWLKTNKLRLHINAKHGITAVMTPESAEKLAARTARDVLNGYWQRNDLFCPTDASAPIFLFLTKQGEERVARAISADSPYKKMGMLADLHDLVGKYQIELVPDPRVFVPFLDEASIKFERQRELFVDGASMSMDTHLILSQFPPELRPI